MSADGESGDAGRSGGGGGGGATVHIRCSNGSRFSVETALDVTVAAFKTAVAEKCEIHADQQRLIYKGRILKDEQTLQSYGVESDHTIHLVRGVALTTANRGTSSAPNSNSGVPRSVGSNEGGGIGGAGFGDSLFPDLGVNGLGSGAPGLFGAGFPEFDQVQQQLTQNPNMMSELMNAPVFQNMMNNPDLMRNLIMSNPQMREILDRNPDLAHVLNDPSTMRQTLEAARNPELMREMMRNTDRAMSNIESSPEGFNMLRRMYETVQEPFLNATAAGETGSGLGSNPFAAILGHPDVNRDRLENPSTRDSEGTTGSPAPNTNPLPNPWSNTPGGAQMPNTRPTLGEARSPSVAGLTAGLAGLGLPELSSMPDPALLNQFLQNPAVAQMMQSLLSNPQNINQFFNVNPQLGASLESNTQLREMLSSPEMMQQLLGLNQSILGQVGRQQSSQDQNQTGTDTGTQNTGLEFWMNMLGGVGAGNLGVPSPSNVPPEELYATQLSQLQEMGFFDTQENIRALSATRGNVNAAVERLLGNLGH